MLDALRARVLLAWHEHAATRRRERGTMVGVLASITRRTEVLVLQAWRAYVAEAARMCLRAISRWSDASVAWAFDSWREAACARREAAEAAAADAAGDDSLRSLGGGAASSAEVVELRQQLGRTRRDLARVQASAAWKYELAVVRNELKMALAALATHADGLGSGRLGGGGHPSVHPIVPSPPSSPPYEGVDVSAPRAGGGVQLREEAEEETPRVLGEILRGPDGGVSTPLALRRQTYPLRPSSAGGWNTRQITHEVIAARDEWPSPRTMPAGAGRRGAAREWRDDEGPPSAEAWALDTALGGVVGDAVRPSPRPPPVSAYQPSGPSAAAGAAARASPRARALAHEVTMSVGQRLDREGELVGLYQS